MSKERDSSNSQMTRSKLFSFPTLSTNGSTAFWILISFVNCNKPQPMTWNCTFFSPTIAQKPIKYFHLVTNVQNADNTDKKCSLILIKSQIFYFRSFNAIYHLIFGRNPAIFFIILSFCNHLHLVTNTFSEQNLNIHKIQNILSVRSHSGVNFWFKWSQRSHLNGFTSVRMHNILNLPLSELAPFFQTKFDF